MPEIARAPLRMDCPHGLNLVDAVDRMRPGSFPFLANCRVVEEGVLEARPGYAPYGTSSVSPKLYHSIRRLNDPDQSLAASGYTYIVGNGTTVDAGTESTLAQVDTGYSGNPLSILTFRPEQSPESWAYIYDADKQSKVRADGMVRAIGVAPPNAAPNADYGIPAWVEVTDGQATTGWAATGIDSGPTQEDRTNSDTDTLTTVIYDSGTTGWCCIQPAVTMPFWMGERMQVILNTGQANVETVVVREIHNAITSTTIAGILYDSGTTGLCSIVLTGNPVGLDRNSLIQIVGGGGTEIVRVLSVTLSPDGSVYSLRTVTANAHASTATVNGILSWYVYTVQTHVATETITSHYIQFGHAAQGVGGGALTAGIDASTANSRPIDTANDYLKISIFLQNPQNVVNVQLLLTLDATPNFSFTNPGNSWIYTITQAQLNDSGSSGDAWAEVILPLSSGERSGSDYTRTLADITGVAIQMTSTGACSWGFDWFYLFGTYGPVIQPNAPSGYFYSSTFRDSTTGAASVPGPTTRYSLNPLREAVIVTPATTTAPGVDSDDIYREGGTLTSFVFVGSVANNSGSPNSFTDGLSDFAISANPGVDLTLLQPWPVLGLPLTSVVDVAGTSVKWVSGSRFPLSMLNNTDTLLNGTAFLTRGQPHSATFLELDADAGVLTNATLSIVSPTLAGQALPLAFGPLEGPFAPVAFALGDMVNSGTLYFSNTSNLDAASDQNTLELCGPTEPLVTGEVWNGLAFAGSRENVYLVRYSFLASEGGTPYQFSRLPGASGFWSRWGICRGPDGIYALGRDGIYRWSDGGGENISDSLLYPLFPHDGQPATGANGLLPVDMTQINFMRLSYTDESIRFIYLDTGGNQVTLRYELTEKRWFLHAYADPMSFEYLDEPLVNSPNFPQILQLSRALGLIYKIGGNTDNGADINSQFQTPYIDGGDERLRKLPVDFMTDSDGSGSLDVAMFFDNGTSNTAATTIILTGPRVQTPVNVSSVPNGLALYRNMSIKCAWTGGPSGPRVFATEPSFYLQPYLSNRITTQFFNLSFPAWHMHRRLYAGLISNGAVQFIIYCQNGINFTIDIPSTNGKFLIQPIMLNQTIKDLALAYELNSPDLSKFALFPEAFTIETKAWGEDSFIQLAVFKA